VCQDIEVGNDMGQALAEIWNDGANELVLGDDHDRVVNENDFLTATLMKLVEGENENGMEVEVEHSCEPRIGEDREILI
jgi:hypothetical protein